MTRKQFIHTSGLSALALGCPISLLAKDTTITKLTILHTNDQHSRIEPFPKNDARNGGKGGFAQRATVIENIRKTEKNILLLDSGDIFQGTPYFNYFGGELEFKLMSKMGYDLSTMGNHDFDNGLEGFKKQLPHAKFDFVCSNYDFKNTILDGLTKPYKIFIKSGIKIGIFGMGIKLKGLVPDKLYLETKYLDPVEIATDMSNLLKNEKKCDLVICLSHLGYEYKNEPDTISDVKLAALSKNIDIILGGHTHTFLKEPVLINNSDNQKIIVNQVGFAGIMLGRIDLFFDQANQLNQYSFNNQIIEDTLKM